MSIEAMFQKANAAQAAGNFAEAERAYRALVQLKPLWAHHNLAVLYVRTGGFAEAEQAFRDALAADPTAAPARYGLAMLLLSEGRYAEGWAAYEARRETGDPNIPRPNLPYPEWRGEDLAGKHIVVVREQGFGDQIQFARFIPVLVARGAQVTFVCSPQLVEVFRDLRVALLPAGQARAPAADYWVLLGSLPLRLGAGLDNLPPPVRIDRPHGAGGGIGVMTRGAPSHVNDRFRSLGPAEAARLLALGRNLAPEATGAADFAQTADIVAGLDLVVSVDTAVAHLAASLGKPCWVLLSAYETDWRWLRERRDSPWYPSVRLFRQQRIGDWSDVLASVEREAAAPPRS